MLYELKYTNDLGEFIEFGKVIQGFFDTIGVAVEHRNSFLLVNFEGFGEVGADVQLQKAPFQDGSTHVDTLLDERTPYIEFIIHADNFAELSTLRKKTGRVFNPKVNGCFTLSYDDKTYQIKAIPEHVPIFSNEDKVGRTQIASVNFICPNPYWKSTTITEEPMAAFVELFEFPSDYWEVGDDGDLYFEMGTQGEKRAFTIKGDAEAPIKITFNGPSTNPVIRNNTTGEYIKVNRTLEAGDVLFIDTDNVTVEINGQNVFNWIDLGSTFWKLQVGENEIEYTADSGQDEAKLTIQWQEQFVAV